MTTTTTLINLAELVIERLALFGQEATLLPAGDAHALHLRFEIAGVPVRYSIWPAGGEASEPPEQPAVATRIGEAQTEMLAVVAVRPSLRAGLTSRMRAIAERMWQVPSTRRALAAAAQESSR